MDWKDRLAPMVRMVQPAARIVERVAQVAVHLQRPTVIGVAGVIGTGANALADYLNGPSSPGWNIDAFVSCGQITQAVKAAGGTVRAQQFHDGYEIVECFVDSWQFSVNQRGCITFYANPSPERLEWIRKALDRVLPASISVRTKAEEKGSRYESHEVSLTSHENAQAMRIIAATTPLLDGGRCILLDGKPGVGKTTIAQIIAREAKLGRVVQLDANVVGESRSDFNKACTSSNGDMRDALRLLSPGVVIVDDVDKVSIPLSHIEAMRSSARLVVLTANNGQYDEVLDGALMRAGRVDEVFTIEPSMRAREAPFNVLTDEEWTEVSQWPIAYVNEVKKRLSARAGDVRLEDLRQRLGRKTRSGEVLR